MSTSLDKRFAAIQTIHTKLYRLQFVMTEKVRTMKENEIGNLVSDPKFWCDHIESILAEPESLIMPQQLLTANPKVSQKRKHVKKTSQRDLTDRKDSVTKAIEAIVEKLKIAKSREEGKQLIEDQTSTVLQSIAKRLNIPTGKFGKEQLVEKIVQDAVGYRLDFMTIQEHKRESTGKEGD